VSKNKLIKIILRLVKQQSSNEVNEFFDNNKIIIFFRLNLCVNKDYIKSFGTNYRFASFMCILHRCGASRL